MEQDANGAVRRGDDLYRQGDWAGAVASYDAALTGVPSHWVALANKGAALKQLGRLDEALVSYDRAIAVMPSDALLQFNRANALYDLGRPQDALEGYEQAMAINPAFIEAQNSRGAALRELGRFAEAREAFAEVLRRTPGHPRAGYNHLSTLLIEGRLREGFTALYDRRFSTTVLERRHAAKSLRNLTSLDRLAGARVLIYGSQSIQHGFGDMFQFCRYAHVLRDAGAKVIVGADRPVMRVLTSLGADIEVVDVQTCQEAVEFDYHAPLLGLPAVFTPAVEDIPWSGPYLHAGPGRTSRWKAVIGNHGFRVGVCWQGSTRTDEPGRAFPLSALAGLAAIPGVRLISLHKGAGLGQLDGLPQGMVVESLGEEFDSGPHAFADSAAVIANCDLVLSSDTAIAHLAGAMGVPTWVALRRMPEWRWLVDRSDSPWYPTMRLFRQPSWGDWRGLFEQVEPELRKLRDEAAG